MTVFLLNSFKLPSDICTPTMSAEEQNGGRVAPAASGQVEKPRARLGPTEIVQLENSDSEGEDEGVELEQGEDVDPDFLREYPDDTEVGRKLHSHVPSEEELSTLCSHTPGHATVAQNPSDIRTFNSNTFA